MVPVPLSRPERALPTTAPSIRSRSVAFITWPGVSLVVRRSPGRMAPFSAEPW